MVGRKTRRVARALRLKALVLFVLRWPLLRRVVRAGWHRLPEHRRTRIRPFLPQPAVTPPVKAPVAGRAYRPPPPIDRYESWLEVNEPNARRSDLLAAELDELDEPPLISVVMPVFDPPVELLDRAIRSVADQVYPHWELCVADDASSDEAVARLLADWAGRDDRIKLLRRRENGHISAATNSATALASGDYLAFLDHDDELEPDALAEVALRIAADPSIDVLYTDDDQIDLEGKRFSPQFKPDWSPELLTSYMYLAHLLVVRRSLFEDVGGMRVGFEGSQDYDLALRITERTDRVAHIPRVLYHWRVTPGSTAQSGNEKPYSFEAGRRAVAEAFERRGVAADVFHPEWARRAACGIFSPRFPDDGPSVAVLVPTRNRHELLSKCLESLRATTYRNYTVTVVDNDSDDPDTLDYLSTCGANVLRVPTGEKFRFAQLVNAAVEAVDTDYVLLLNNDTEVLRPEWLSQMVGYLGIDGVGAVGARLLFPDGRIQHAGVVHGLHDGIAGHAFKLLPGRDAGYLSYTKVARNYSAVTAACLLTRRDLFLQLGGFDDARFAVAYNDVDYCYRLVDSGYRVVYCPDAELLHREGASRGVDDPAEPAAFRARYGDRVDPYYNPNLSLEHERFPLGTRTLPPRRPRPIRALMCAFNLNWEGAPYSQFELTVRLRDDGVVEPLVYSPVDGPLRAAYEDAGIEVTVSPPPTTGAASLPLYESRLALLAESMKQSEAELVYANTVQTFYAVDAARAAGIPSIWNPRESEDWRTYFSFLPPEIAARALDCFVYPYQIVFVADATREAWRELDVRQNATTVHNGLAVDRFRRALVERREARRRIGLDPAATVVLCVGTVCDRKGQIDLVEAVEAFPRELLSQLRVLLVGDRPGPYSDRLHHAIRRLDEPRRTCFTVVPETSDVGVYYSAADVFACTSRIESYPRVILEAMAAGLPVVTTPVYGISEQVSPSVNALTYRPGEARELARSLEHLVRDPGERARLARNSALVLATLPDYDAMSRAYASLFREAWLSGAPRAQSGRAADRRGRERVRV